MRYTKKLLLSFILLISPVFCFASVQHLTVTAVNELPFGRLNQTVVISANQLQELGKVDLIRIHVKDAAGRELICQAVDTNGDYHPDEVIFQADFAPHQTRHFIAYEGKRHLYKAKQYKAYGRFVHERFGDFAWENDRIADRAYGKALETWKEEPLTSSAIDVWCKRVKKLVINNWYMMGHVTTDTGEGADLYTAGNSRGVGGNGLWANDKLYVAKNYVKSHVLTDGPIRVMFQLKYDPFNVSGNPVRETKRIALDAGQNLNHFTSYYKSANSGNLITGIGIEKTTKSISEVRKGIPVHHSTLSIERSPTRILRKDVDAKHGWITTEQALSEGKLDCAIIVNPKDFIKVTHDHKNELLLARVPKNGVASYWAGFTWSKSGQFKNYDAWKTYIDHFAQELQSLIQVRVSN
ncbi:MAG TPA: DUF4861 family protein [Balneolales bacterium]|nr:DUF4861 family protein [Balneolales bacterium]